MNFKRDFERKLRKEVRESSIIKDDVIEIIDTKDSNYFVLDDFLRNKIGLPLQFGEGGNSVYPSSLEEKGRNLLLRFLKKGIKDKKPSEYKNEERIELLTSSTQEDIDKFAKLLGYSGKSRDKDPIIKMIDRLDSRFKNIKSGLSKSAEVIESVK
jgi:hypothetical protein